MHKHTAKSTPKRSSSGATGNGKSLPAKNRGVQKKSKVQSLGSKGFGVNNPSNGENTSNTTHLTQNRTGLRPVLQRKPTHKNICSTNVKNTIWWYKYGDGKKKYNHYYSPGWVDELLKVAGPKYMNLASRIKSKETINEDFVQLVCIVQNSLGVEPDGRVGDITTKAWEKWKERQSNKKGKQQGDSFVESLSGIHKDIKEFSGPNIAKITKVIPLKVGKIEFSGVFSLLTGKSNEPEDKVLSPEANPHIRSQLNKVIKEKGPKLEGIIKSGIVGNIAQGFGQVSKHGIYLGYKFFLEGPEIKVHRGEGDMKLGSVKFRGIGRVFKGKDIPFTIDLYVEGSYSLSLDDLKSLVKKRIIKRKIKKRQLKKTVEKVYKAKREVLKKELNKARQKALMSNIRKAAKSKSPILELQKVKGVGKANAKKILKGIKSGRVKSFADLAKIKGIKAATLDKILRTEGIENARIKLLKKKIKFIEDDIRKLATKKASKVFRNAIKNAGKKTVKAVLTRVQKVLALKAMRQILKLIPFVNIAMVLWDIIDLVLLFINVFKDKPPNLVDGDGGIDRDAKGKEDGVSSDKKKGDGDGKENEGNDTSIVKGKGKGLSKNALTKLRKAPGNIQLLWEKITTKTSSGKISDHHLELFLKIIPPQISKEEVDKITGKLSEGKSMSPESILEKLKGIIQNKGNKDLRSKLYHGLRLRKSDFVRNKKFNGTILLIYDSKMIDSAKSTFRILDISKDLIVVKKLQEFGLQYSYASGGIVLITYTKGGTMTIKRSNIQFSK